MRLRIVSASLVCLSLLLAPVFGCTIFVLTDGARTLFFNNERTYRCRMNFKNASVLQAFVIDKHDQLTSSQSDAIEWK